jgi:16S rRNA (guanine527-N7)-methyltransferase
MKGKRPDEELPGIPAGFKVRGMHELTVPGLPAERHLLVLGRA